MWCLIYIIGWCFHAFHFSSLEYPFHSSTLFVEEDHVAVAVMASTRPFRDGEPESKKGMCFPARVPCVCESQGPGGCR